MGSHEKVSSKERVARRRAALRAQGLRPKQFWVHDTRRPGFWDEINRQARAIASSPQEKEDQAWVDWLQCQLELPPWEPE
jgi:DNA-binding LacI/PurR family transcriptional regulator